MLFTYLQIPVSYSYDLFALFKVTCRFCIKAPCSQSQVLATFGMLPLFQSPLNILCEISDVKNRSNLIKIIKYSIQLKVTFPAGAMSSATPASHGGWARCSSLLLVRPRHHRITFLLRLAPGVLEDDQDYIGLSPRLPPLHVDVSP